MLSLVGLLVALAPSHSCQTLVVTQAAVAYPHYTSIQAAVDAAEPRDWILIDVGTYNETVYITTPRIHLRGIDRNAVVLDGQHQVGNGIEVCKADGVSIENLTVRDFDRPGQDGEDGNEIWWNGGDGSGLIGLHGWKGRYLTTYSTGLNGGYGIFISNSERGSLDQVLRVGLQRLGPLPRRLPRLPREDRARARREQRARLLGHQLRRPHHRAGLDLPQQLERRRPQLAEQRRRAAAAGRRLQLGQNTSDAPTFASTHIQRCTIFQRNVVANNDNFQTPANSTTASIPWGNGFILIGTYADLIDDNTITATRAAVSWASRTPIRSRRRRRPSTSSSRATR